MNNGPTSLKVWYCNGCKCLHKKDMGHELDDYGLEVATYCYLCRHPDQSETKTDECVIQYSRDEDALVATPVWCPILKEQENAK